MVEYERALFRVYERSLDTLRFDQVRFCARECLCDRHTESPVLCSPSLGSPASSSRREFVAC
jgi:hypothetical protein